MLQKLLSPAAHYKFWTWRLSQISYLLRSGAPLNLIKSYIFSIFKNKSYLTPANLNQKIIFKNKLNSLNISSDWFSENIPFWIAIFDEYSLWHKENLQILEIGSWEGVSSFFLLDLLPQAHLTCVDTWQGAAEHTSGFSATQAVLDNIESSFDQNVSQYKSRLSKYKGTSISFFSIFPSPNKFDLIYIDGSHHCDDVLIDALRSFTLLNVGGIIIFDDYFFQYYSNSHDDTAPGINAFLRIKSGRYKIIRFYHQLVIEKICE